MSKAIAKFGHRSDDFLSRLSKDQFALLLPDCSQRGANYIAECIVESVEQLVIPHESSSSSQFITVSLGTATIRPELEQPPI